ncbi:acetyl-CoA C-acetyltransferase [Vibrio marisflavi]|uniref:Acetyl-CoA acetyltransferase n=1 Tax=Vibrio marisflavi CECT 7928 TaxID=634439 RepID=A0ABM8ZYR1_9VIBR|nr:acetyl-CoA C-acetyltransferase [Vibrio marisflavi]CAH0536089.1 Acetyl-CoA acetyltransferase [Vibrio marisflavi CECT 7928]
MENKNVFVLGASRTALGSFGGTLSGIPATELGATVIKSMLEQQSIDPSHVDEVIVGQVLTAGCGQNPARQTAIAAGIPEHSSALTINKVCGSGLKALQLAYQAIKNGDADLVIAGGQENMSQAPHILPNSRNGVKMGNWTAEDTMIKDGLWDAFNDYHMGTTAENIAKKYDISREEQDEFAYQSQMKAAKALEANRLADEIVPVAVPRKRQEPLMFAQDEFPRPQTTVEGLAKLRPAFDKAGSITAGNASGVNDGAAMVILASEQKVKELGLQAMARLVNFATVGVDPTIMGTGPIQASRKVLDKSNWNMDELDLIESNEAFAAQAISVNKEMQWDTNKVNVNGGSIAFGHPIGASGARIFVTLVNELKRQELSKGLATLCIGGGMGIAATVEML